MHWSGLVVIESNNPALSITNFNSLIWVTQQRKHIYQQLCMSPYGMRVLATAGAAACHTSLGQEGLWCLGAQFSETYVHTALHCIAISSISMPSHS